MDLAGLLNSGATALFGVLVAALARAALKRCRDAREERKASVKGTYRTSTTGSAFRAPGEANSGGPTRRGLVLTQRGAALRGVEQGESGFTWLIIGEVSGEFITGTYRQTSPPSVVDRGAFHLQRDHHDPNTFNGLWVGWNPETREITQGQYQWTRIEADMRGVRISA